MSATMIKLEFFATIVDRDYLPRNMETEDVVRQLDSVMREAGLQLCSQHPDWFKVELT